MNEPISKLYPSFEGWLNGRKSHVQAYLDPAKRCMCYSWYKGNANISVHSKAQYQPSLFPTGDIQRDYKFFLKGDGVQGDPVSQKFQSGNIMADERAFYVRHALISELMACGFMGRKVYDFMEELYKAHIQHSIDLSVYSKNKLEQNV